MDENDLTLADPNEDTQVIPLAHEDATARTQWVERGAVRLRTRVVERRETVRVPRMRERLHVTKERLERVPVDYEITGPRERSFILHEEHVALTRRPVVVEQVVLRSHPVQGLELTGTKVRREEPADAAKRPSLAEADE